MIDENNNEAPGYSVAKEAPESLSQFGWDLERNCLVALVDGRWVPVGTRSVKDLTTPTALSREGQAA